MFSIKSTALAILAIVVILAGGALSIRHQQRTIDHQAQQLKDEHTGRVAAETALKEARANEVKLTNALNEQNDAINLLEAAGRQQQDAASKRALAVLHNSVDLDPSHVYTLRSADHVIGNGFGIDSGTTYISAPSGAEGMNSWLHARFPVSQ